MKTTIVAAFPVLLACGCTGAPADAQDAPAGQIRVSVRVEYHAKTAIDPAVVMAAPDCVRLVVFTRVHPGWESYRIVGMSAETAEVWSVDFHDVPIGTTRLRVSDPNACADDPNGAVTAHLVDANGILLTRNVETPGAEGPEPGFGFSVDASGVVTP